MPKWVQAWLEDVTWFTSYHHLRERVPAVNYHWDKYMFPEFLVCYGLCISFGSDLWCGFVSRTWQIVEGWVCRGRLISLKPATCLLVVVYNLVEEVLRTEVVLYKAHVAGLGLVLWLSFGPFLSLLYQLYVWIYRIADSHAANSECIPEGRMYKLPSPLYNTIHIHEVCP